MRAPRPENFLVGISFDALRLFAITVFQGKQNRVGSHRTMAIVDVRQRHFYDVLTIKGPASCDGVLRDVTGVR